MCLIAGPFDLLYIYIYISYIIPCQIHSFHFLSPLCPFFESSTVTEYISLDSKQNPTMNKFLKDLFLLPFLVNKAKSTKEKLHTNALAIWLAKSGH